MRCDEAAVLLNSLQVGAASPSPGALDPGSAFRLDELVRGGFVEALEDGGEALADLARKKAELAEALAIWDGEGTTAQPALATRIATLRSEVLDLSERAARAEGSLEVGGRRFALTYKGRTLLSNLMTRLDRVGSTDLAAFEAELDTLKRSFSARAKKASEILKDLKGANKDLDESALRVAAVGLAAREEGPRELGNAFEAAARALTAAGVAPYRVPTLAECLVLAGRWRSTPMAAEADALMALQRGVHDALGADSSQDSLGAASLLIPFEPTRRESLIAEAARFKAQLESAVNFRAESLSAFVLFAASGLSTQQPAQDWVMRMRSELLARGSNANEAEMAVAVLATSKRESGVELAFQFDVARSYLSRLSSGGMVVPAAMLAVLGSGIEESLDDLRLASAAVTGEGLSPGGMESLSLGLKVLIQTAVLASAPPSAGFAPKLGPTDAAIMSSFGLPGLTLVLPVALTAFAAFHEVSIHRFSTSEYAYHPVHTHYIYG